MTSYFIVFVDMKFAESCLSTIVLKNGYESNVLKVSYKIREAVVYLLPTDLSQSQSITELCHMDVCHVVFIECSHLVNGCTIKCSCIGLILFRYLSCVGALICEMNTIGFVSVCMQRLWRFGCKLCNHSLGVHEPKWASYNKREIDFCSIIY